MRLRFDILKPGSRGERVDRNYLNSVTESNPVAAAPAEGDPTLRVMVHVELLIESCH